MRESIELSSREFAVLASAFEAEVILGFEDPFLGYLVEEVDYIVEQETISSLLKKGMITSIHGEIYELNPEVESVLRTAVIPAVTLILSHHRMDKESHDLTFFHMLDGGIVEQNYDGNCILLKFLKMTETSEYFGDLAGLGTQKSPSREDVLLPRNLMKQTSIFLVEQGKEETRELLLGAGVKEEVVAPFQQAISNLLSISVFIGIDRTSHEWEVSGCTFLKGKNGLWSVHPFDKKGEPWIRMEPISGERARLALKEWLECVYSPVRS
jgi:hypothetical protein